MPRGQGPAALLRGRGPALQPASQAPLRASTTTSPSCSSTRPRRSTTPSTNASWPRPTPPASSPRSAMADRRRLARDVRHGGGVPGADRGGRGHGPPGRGPARRHDDIENVVVLGMGGSGIAGDVLAASPGRSCRCRSSWSRATSHRRTSTSARLVFAMSFSGDTEETLEAATTAANAGGRIVAVTRGGALAELCRSWGAPVVGIADGHPQAAGRHRRGGGAADDRPRAARPVPRRRGLAALRRRPAQGPPGPARPRRQPGRAPGRRHRPVGPRHLRRGWPRGPGRHALEDPVQRERQVARLRQRHPRALPQRDLRAGARTAT